LDAFETFCSVTAAMIIHDPIYGRFETPPFLDVLIMSPEVRRLADVRLLNAPSPSLATLSEIRRLSHTLGVVYLALQNALMNLSEDEVKALLAAILIHDAATPPFAHLLEYYLKDQSGWDHESAIEGMLTGHNVPGNLAFQILPGEAIVYKKLCERADIDFDIVLDITSKRHRAASLLFGTMDFDNLDNVLRMNWALGLPCNKDAFLALARNIQVSLDGTLLLPRGFEGEAVEWANARKQAYEVIVFDELACSAQAVLTKAIRRHLAQDKAGEAERVRVQRDQDLVEILRRSPTTKIFMLKHFANLPRLAFCHREEGSLQSLGFASRDAAIDWIEDAAKVRGKISNPVGYVLVDKGTFSKRLVFEDPNSRQTWETGETSASLVFYCFVPSNSRSSSLAKEALQEQLKIAIAELRAHHAYSPNTSRTVAT